MIRLKDVLPFEAVNSAGYINDRFQKYLNYEVI